MATCKFNVGDMVKRIRRDNDWYDGRKLKVGTICEVVRVGYTIDVKVDGKLYDGNDPDCFELVERPSHKFKVGDKVIGNHPTRYAYTKKGWKGVVTRVSPNGYIAVKGEGNTNHNSEFVGLESKYFDLVPTNEEKIVITHNGKTTTATKYCTDGSKVTATARCAPEDEFDFNVGAKLAMERLMEKIEPVVVDGFKVGDRVNWKGHNGTVICIGGEGSATNQLGVEFDDKHVGIHNCGGFKLKAGNYPTSGNARWFNPKDLTHGEAPVYYNGKVVCVDNCNVPKDLTVGKVYTFVDGRCENDLGGQITNSPVKDFNDLQRRFTRVKFIPLVE